jgi:hypothetical protein
MGAMGLTGTMGPIGLTGTMGAMGLTSFSALSPQEQGSVVNRMFQSESNRNAINELIRVGNTNLQTSVMWCADGELCSIPTSKRGFSFGNSTIGNATIRMVDNEFRIATGTNDTFGFGIFNGNIRTDGNAEIKGRLFPSYENVLYTDAPGNGIGGERQGNWNECKALCDSDSNCRGFNFSPMHWPNGRSFCYLKNSVVNKRNNASTHLFIKNAPITQQQQNTLSEIEAARELGARITGGTGPVY